MKKQIEFASIKLLTESPFENIEKHLKEGQIFEGVVSKIVDYGAFVSITLPDLGSTVEALCHSSELSYTNRTIKPSKVLSVSQKTNFKVVAIDKENKKISVSLKQCLIILGTKLKNLGSVAKLKINNITDKLLFGELEEYGIETMLHWKELSFEENLGELKKYKNQVIDVKIVSVEDEKVKVSKRALDKDPWDYFKENNKSVGDVITTRVIEVLKSGAVKVAADPDKKIVSTIKRSDLALDAADARSDIFSGGEKLDAKILELDYMKRIIRLSPKEAQKDEQASLVKKFGKNASKSGQTLASIFKKAMGKKEKEN